MIWFGVIVGLGIFYAALVLILLFAPHGKGPGGW